MCFNLIRGNFDDNYSNIILSLLIIYVVCQEIVVEYFDHRTNIYSIYIYLWSIYKELSVNTYAMCVLYSTLHLNLFCFAVAKLLSFESIDFTPSVILSILFSRTNLERTVSELWFLWWASVCEIVLIFVSVKWRLPKSTTKGNRIWKKFSSMVHRLLPSKSILAIRLAPLSIQYKRLSTWSMLMTSGPLEVPNSIKVIPTVPGRSTRPTIDFQALTAK